MTNNCLLNSSNEAYRSHLRSLKTELGWASYKKEPYMEIIQRKNGTKYRDRVTLPNGKVISKTFSRKTDLLNWKNSMLTEIAKNKALGWTFVLS